MLNGACKKCFFAKSIQGVEMPNVRVQRKYKVACSEVVKNGKFQPNTMQANQYTAKNFTGEEGNYENSKLTESTSSRPKISPFLTLLSYLGHCQKLSLRNRLLRVLLGFYPIITPTCILIKFFVLTCHFLSVRHFFHSPLMPVHFFAR